MGGLVKWGLLALVIVLIVLYAFCRPSGPVSGPTTRLEFEAYGGFAYVPSPRDGTMEIAYLKDSTLPGCAVDQIGTDLMVIEGNIVDPKEPPANRMFDVGGAVVKFPDLDESNETLVAKRGPRPVAPFQPGNTSDVTLWEDLQWVPSVSSEYPNSSLHPDWRNMVDGRVVLNRGRLVAAPPSDIVVQDALFEFKTPSGSKSFRQAITDTTRYVATVPRDRVVITLNGTNLKYSRIEVTPIAQGRPVKLKLIGRHSHGSPSDIPLDTPINHFCAFYALLQPVPPVSEQLIPHFFGNPGVAAANRDGQPSPGALCPGDGF